MKRCPLQTRRPKHALLNLQGVHAEEVPALVSCSLSSLPVPAGNPTLLPRISGHKQQTVRLTFKCDFEKAAYAPSLTLHLSLSQLGEENPLLAQFKWNLPSCRQILTFNILALCWQVYIQLSSYILYCYRPVVPLSRSIKGLLYFYSQLWSDTGDGFWTCKTHSPVNKMCFINHIIHIRLDKNSISVYCKKRYLFIFFTGYILLCIYYYFVYLFC